MGYDGFKTTIELLWEEEVTADSAVTDDLIRALPDRQWVQKDFFRLTPYQRLRGAWEGFVHSVKHESRYFFGLRKPDPDDPDDVPPLLLLSTLGEVIEEASLIRAWAAGTLIYRARPHAATETYTDAWDLSAVPMANADRAAANRMSAAGVPMFYGSLSPDTAEAETVSTLPAPPEAVTIAAFTLTRVFRMLDLGSGVDVPSLFDPDQGDRRAEFAFLRGFLQDAAQDVRRDGQEHIAYVPTQVVCEYFRSQFRTSDGDQLDGIAYPSLRSPGEVNVVLFMPNDAVANRDGSRPPRPETERWLGPLNLGPEPLLQLDSIDRREKSSDV